MSKTLRRRQSSHWGAFTAIVENGRMTDVAPIETDPNPSPLIDSMPDALYADCRVEQPMVRKGWLEEGPGVASARRGADPFVKVDWDKAVDLVTDELTRVKDT
ncbi:MAG: Asp-tRNA(Asn)/Glu-tRNA(Gln) amidotransferase GatCAB subunit C, partial [Pseudomonadota bacterium]|nr:Asp-tRNA(Asn)/Glu-tRNA(Gln) amidotransferase GatCAB subunit C [Pseudomonadota bacterium]